VAFTAALAATSCKKGAATSTTSASMKASESESRPTVVCEIPQQSSAKQRLSLPGTLEPWERARLFAKVPGYVSALEVDIGDRVKKGQLLARLSIPEMAAQSRKASADIPAAQAQIEKAKADGELARVTLERLTKLRAREPGAITQQEVDVALAKKKAADAHVQAVESGLNVAKARVGEIYTMMSYGTIKAPFGGVITQRNADIGALVSQDTKDPIVEVSRIEKLRLALELPEAVVPHVKVGHEVEFFVDAMPGKTFQGIVARRAGALTRGTRSMRIEVDVDNTEGELSAGMYAKVEFGYRELSGALTLPAKAIKSHEGASYILVADEDDTLKKVPVTLLMDDGKEVVCTGPGLDASSRVVVTAPPSVVAGQAVEVRENKATESTKKAPEGTKRAPESTK
jgi:RND family efflux transporter MFP subunit